MTRSALISPLLTQQEKNAGLHFCSRQNNDKKNTSHFGFFKKIKFPVKKCDTFFDVKIPFLVPV